MGSPTNVRGSLRMTAAAVSPIMLAERMAIANTRPQRWRLNNPMAAKEQATQTALMRTSAIGPICANAWRAGEFIRQIASSALPGLERLASANPLTHAPNMKKPLSARTPNGTAASVICASVAATYSLVNSE